MTDKELHSMFKQGLGGLQPDFNPAHWEAMKAKLHADVAVPLDNSGPGQTWLSRNWKSLSIAASLALLILLSFLLIGRLYQDTPTYVEAPSTVVDPENESGGLGESNAFGIPDGNPFDNQAGQVETADQENKEILSTSLADLGVYRQVYNQKNYIQVDKYEPLATSPQARIFIPMGYGDATFNEEKIKGIDPEEVVGIDLVYTDHPFQIDLRYLNSQRLINLNNILSFADQDNVDLRLIAQHGFSNMKEAKGLFHGFVVYLRDDQSLNFSEVIAVNSKDPIIQVREPDAPKVLSLLEKEIRELVLNNKSWSDSATYKVFDRNKDRWNSSVVVFDWTSSMFMHGAQATSWISDHQDNGNIKSFVFFNDCDEEGVPVVDSQNQGAFFHVKPSGINDILETMIDAAAQGVENKDKPENDFEAIVHAIESYPEVEEIILVADNKSSVRDAYLLKNISKPVRIILCGTTLSNYNSIQRDYIRLARETGGSLHVVENDIINLAELEESTVIKIGDGYYKYKVGYFKKVHRK